MRIYIALAILLVLYLLPWLVNPAVSLTPNAYALAEWTSLHPAVRDASLPLLTSFLLRLPLACMVLLVAFATRRGILPALVVIGIALALLPPLEFIQATDDPNYRQQAALAVITLLGGALGFGGILTLYHRWIATAVALAGALATLIGLAQGYELMRGFDLSTQVGLGGVGLALALLIVAGGLVLGETSQRRRALAPNAVRVNQPG